MGYQWNRLNEPVLMQKTKLTECGIHHRWEIVHCLFSRLVAMNKMVCHFWHQFLTQFSLLFQMVPFFFLSMAALRTTNTKLSDWLLELFQPIRLWLSELPYRAKWMVPSERALKTKSETGVKSFTPFCWGSSLRKTNSEFWSTSTVNFHLLKIGF